MADINLLEPAERFVLKHLTRLDEIDREVLERQTVAHLASQYACSRQTAGLFAARAIANIESRGIDAYIDMDNSTSTCLFIRVKGRLRALSIGDLVKTLENEQDTS